MSSCKKDHGHDACQNYVTLNNGAKMPLLGLGTLQAKGDETVKAVEDAIDAGYRHIDTAFSYYNEAEIGKAINNKIAAGKIKREDIFVTTKLPASYMEADRVGQALEKSLKALNIGYIDMYLVHSPIGFVYQGDEVVFSADAEGNSLHHPVDHAAVWKAMEKAVESGKVKSIGISNFNRRQIQFILDNCTIKPANLQIEVHLYLQQKPLVEFCQKNGIVVSAYGPLGSPSYVDMVNKKSGQNLPGVLNEPALEPLKTKYNKTSAQILLRWLTQRHIVALPKSTNQGRLVENINIFDFELTKEEMEALAAIDKGLRLFAASILKNMDKSKDYPYGPNDPY